MTGSRRQLLLVPIALMALLSCSSPPTVIPVRNLERPSDMTFVCLERSSDDHVSARPMNVCNPRGQLEPVVKDPNDDKRRLQGTFSLVTNTARGELAAIDIDEGRIIDLDPGNPGFGQLPVGAFPEVITTTSDGCRAVTANRGSCNLSVVDTTQVLARTFGVPSSTTVGLKDGEAAPPLVRNIQPHDPVSGVVIAARPYDVAAVPQNWASSGLPLACSASTADRVLVTYPGCNLVAVVEVPSGRIVSAIQSGSGGPRVVTDLSALRCPSECANGRPLEPFADAGVLTDQNDAAPVTDAGGDASGSDAGSEPPAVPTKASDAKLGPMAVMPDGSRVFVGGLQTDGILVFELTDGRLALPASSDPWIALNEGAGGTTRLRLSVDPYAVSSASSQPAYLGAFVGASQKRYLYAFATDGSVRVVALGVATSNPPPQECHVSINPAAESAKAVDVYGCVPLSDVNRRDRLPLARGPGLRVPETSAPANAPAAIPLDVSFANIASTAALDDRQLRDATRGAFAYLLTSNGQVLIVNIESERGDLPNTVRNDASSQPVETPHTPRSISLFSSPVRDFSYSDLRYSVPRRLDVGPVLSQFSFQSYNLSAAQNWAVVWEGVLSRAQRTTGRLEGVAACAAAHGGSADGVDACLVDVGADFCGAGVLAGDVVRMVGCTIDSDCSLDDSKACLSLAPGAEGLCWPRSRPRAEAERCIDFVRSRRRYEVARASGTRLELRPKALEYPVLGACKTESADDCDPQSGDQGFRCRELHPGEPPRCVRVVSNPCTQNSCPAGFSCQSMPGNPTESFCAEAPPTRAECWPDDRTFRVQVGRSFLVTGSVTSDLPVVRRGANGFCEARPRSERSRMIANRVSLDAPMCADGNAGAMPPFTDGPNRSDSPCRLGATSIVFQNPDVAFVMENANQYLGDGLGIRFSTQYGFRPDAIDTTSSDVFLGLGTRIVTGPNRTAFSKSEAAGPGTFIPHIYVVDQGRTGVGGRGQVLRIDPRGRSSDSLSIQSGFFDSAVRKQTWPVQ